MPEDKKKILVVDDEEDTCLLLSKVLSREGHDVLIAYNGAEALEIFEREEVKLIITDMKMPKMDGISFLKKVRKTHPHIRVIIMTAYGGVESYLDAMNFGAFEYLNKPFEIKELMNIINNALDIKSAEKPHEKD